MGIFNSLEMRMFKEVMEHKKKTEKNLRIRGIKGSPQSKLRGELYKEGFERIKKGLEEGNYFEVISLVDSIISDRLTSVIQYIRGTDELDFTVQSVGVVIRYLLKDIKDKEIEVSDEYLKLIKKIDNEWLPQRNISIHSFVRVTEKSLNSRKDDRLDKIKKCGEEGSILCRQLVDQSDKLIRSLI